MDSQKRLDRHQVAVLIPALNESLRIREVVEGALAHCPNAVSYTHLDVYKRQVDTLCGSVLFGFNALQLVSKQPCRPFDAARDGLSLGEAGGFAVLERSDAGNEAALQLRGYGESSDAHHLSLIHI